MESALFGIRVLELTHVWAGPLAGRVLADLGAEVIHIRSRAMVDNSPVNSLEAEFLGTFPDNDPGWNPWDRHVLGNDLNRNKLGLSLELNTDIGTSVFKRLVAVSDVVLDNFSPRVMHNFGLDYPVLEKLNPGIIVCRMPGYGLSGPYRDHVSFGTTIEAACGLSHFMRYSDQSGFKSNQGPLLSGNPYPDPAAAMHAVGAILTALLFRSKTGIGQQVDLSQSESATCLMGEKILEYGVHQKETNPIGNRHPHDSPCGCYPCKGEDKWVVIEIYSEEEWQTFVYILGNPSWAKDPKFLNVSRRLRYQDELDEYICEWTKKYSHYEIMHRLQKQGITAGAVLNAEELLNDAHINDRQFFKEIYKPGIGSRKYAGLPIRLKHGADIAEKPAPFLGEHNHYVLRKILGLSEPEVKDLEEQGVIGNEPIE